MSDHESARDIITADELVGHGFDPDWARRLPVATFHNAAGDPYWVRAELEPWLRGEGGPTS